MSIRKLTLIICDGCGITYASGDLKQWSGTRQRKGYKDDGWLHISTYDYCPECKRMA